MRGRTPFLDRLPGPLRAHLPQRDGPENCHTRAGHTGGRPFRRTEHPSPSCKRDRLLFFSG